MGGEYIVGSWGVSIQPENIRNSKEYKKRIEKSKRNSISSMIKITSDNWTNDEEES